MPVPCSEEFMEEVRAWQHIDEDEDEEAMKLQYYGITDIEGITGKVKSLPDPQVARLVFANDSRTCCGTA